MAQEKECHASKFAGRRPESQFGAIPDAWPGGRTAKRFNRLEGRTCGVLDLLEGMAKDELLDWRDRIPLERVEDPFGC
jgi:hypothetical protein